MRLDLIASTQHDRFADSDYAMVAGAGFLTARDGVRWHLVDRGGAYDFSSLEPLAAAAQKHGVQVIWNLCHYGWPDGVELLSPAFIDRYARYARAVARYFRDRTGGPLFFAPVNEISFFSWAAGRFMYPYAKGQDGAIKQQLVRAAIAGIEAIRDVDRDARFLHGDPIIHIVHPRRKPECARYAAEYNESQFHAWDMICGRMNPELGGHPRYLDIVGCNYYHDNQWQMPGGRKLAWHKRPLDDRWIPLHRLLEGVWKRYNRPMIIAETSHFGRGRGKWIKEIAVEAVKARSTGVPLEAVCLYPILDRHDWEDVRWWHNCGMWDLKRDRRGTLRRVLHAGYFKAFQRAQQIVSGAETMQNRHGSLIAINVSGGPTAF